MCEHNKRNKGDSYCAYCRVNELTDQIDSVKAYLQSIIDLGVIDAIGPKEVAVAKAAMNALDNPGE